MPRDYWTPEEEKILRDCFEQRISDREIQAILPNRTLEAIRVHRLAKLRLKRWNLKAYTKDEILYLREAWAKHVPVEEIADKLNRSYGSVKQKIHKLGLKRDAKKTCLARKYGYDALAIDNDPEVIKAVMADNLAKRKAATKAARDAQNKAAVDKMVADLQGGMPRQLAMQACRLRGVTLQQIADRLNITRERVRQITCNIPNGKGHRKALSKATKPRNVTCARCGIDFTVATHGAFRYCSTCYPLQQAELYQKQLERERAARLLRGI